MAEASTNPTENDCTLQTTSSGTCDVRMEIKPVVDARKAQLLAQLLMSGEAGDTVTGSSGTEPERSTRTDST